MNGARSKGQRSGAAVARPTISISAGDPLGIGPEIVVMALADASVRSIAKFRVHGSAGALAFAAGAAGLAPLTDSNDLRVLDDNDAGPIGPDRGPTAWGGAASFRYVERCIADALRPPGHPDRADAIVTAPISKSAWQLAGVRDFPGHTELLHRRFGAGRSGMLFVGPRLSVMLATIHIPLREVADALSEQVVRDAIELADLGCRRTGVTRPRLAVCGLNPHAGEGGMLGDEETRIIAPAIAGARSLGVDARGPFPADTVFGSALRDSGPDRRFDCVVAMYHDQGLIASKLADGPRAVNVTVGLPLRAGWAVRTSPAHGTAFDIAGTGRADPTSMIEAIRLAVRMTGP